MPKFPDGRINYTDCFEAPVTTIFVFYRGKILLLRRSNKVAAYQGKWNVVAGYLDDPKVALKDKVIEEVTEELGVNNQKLQKLFSVITLNYWILR